MNVLSLDTETTTWNKGNPFDSRNFAVCFSWASSNNEKGASKDFSLVDGFVNKAKLIVGFNFKFDLHWFLKQGVYQLRDKQLWDVQIAEFILSNQTNRFPSLDDTCQKYGIAKKLDVVKTEYWDLGINTDAIPWPVLSEYAEHDADITLQCYYKQIALMTPAQKTLCYLMCQDLHILQDMEWNGLPFDENLCAEEAQKIDERLIEINKELSSIYPDIPINFNSGPQLSAFLYGGVVEEEYKEHVGFFKTGKQAGQPKYQNAVKQHILPRLFTPLRGTEMKKENVYATDTSTLRKLKGKKHLIELLLEQSRLEKLNSTYYKGLVELRKEMHWDEGILHGQFNQVVAQTGRLSSTKPNLQNFASELQNIFISRYPQ